MKRRAIVGFGLLALLSLAVIGKPESSGLSKFDRSNSLLGPDVDHDGIRDDIDKYIEVIAAGKKYTPQQVMAMRQMARAYQHLLAINVNDKDQLAEASEKYERASSCIFFRFEEKDILYVSGKLQDHIFNTKKRIVAYENYINDNALYGSEDPDAELPPEDATSCDSK